MSVGRLDVVMSRPHYARTIFAALALGLVAACAYPVPVTPYPPPPAGPRATDPECVGRVVTHRDTLVTAVYASVGFDRPAPPVTREFRDDVLRALAARYMPPDTISAPMVAAAAFFPHDSIGKVPGMLSAGPLFDGELLIVFDGGGRVEETRVTSSPDSPELMPALIRAVHRTDSARGFPSLPFGASRERTPVRIRLFGSRSTLPPPTDSAAHVITLAEPRFLISFVDVAPLAIAGSGSPHYPVELRSQGMEGKVFMQFIVDAEGRAVDSSARTVFASHQGFEAVVRKALPEMRFVPGRVGGCPVPTWVRLAFEFRLGGWAPPPFD